MSQVPANNIQIEYDTFGDRNGLPLILIMGLNAQMIAWPREFCVKLADRGHYVVRFDNRDVGLSSKIEQGGKPNTTSVLTDGLAGGNVSAAYTLSDMACDTIGLLDALEIEKAHICGISMGGMIAQTVAIDHPGRVSSLISMESTTGDHNLPQPTQKVMEVLISAPPSTREGYIEHMVKVFGAFAAGSSEFDEALQRELSAQAFDRGYYPFGFPRQLAAIMSSGSRKEALGSVSVPSLVIHGTIDPLVLPEHGQATADAIPGAKLHMIEHLGHGFAYPKLWGEIADKISEHTENAA